MKVDIQRTAGDESPVLPAGLPSPLITVVLPVKDGMPYLPEAVESMWAQTLRDFQLLVIDDGSTDRTRDFLAQIRDPRLRVVRNEASQGVAASLNRGIGLASSPLIGRQDADDVSLPDRLRLQADYMAAHPDCLVLGTQGREIDATGRDIGPYLPRPTDERGMEKLILKGSPVIHGSVVMRREAVVAVGGYRGQIHRAEDYDLWLRLAARGKLANLPTVQYRYRVHEGQICTAFRSDSLRDEWLCKVLNWERKCMGDEDSLSVLTGAQLAAIRDARLWRPRGGWARRVRVLWHYAKFIEAGSPRRAALARLLAVTGGW